DLDDRRVEITGPVERKMMINALNSGARVFMADFEDATSPTWENVVDGQANCIDAVRRRLAFTAPEGKEYRLGEQLATLVVRPRGTIRATVLIETILAAFEMEEILHELREHAAGLNAGRWDYIFSIIKKFRNRGDMVLPDRAAVTMTVPFMRAYARRLVATC